MAFRRPGVRIPSAPSLSRRYRRASADRFERVPQPLRLVPRSRPPLARGSTSAAAASITPGRSRPSSHGPSSSPLSRHPPSVSATLLHASIHPRPGRRCPSGGSRPSGLRRPRRGRSGLAEDAVVLVLDAVDLPQLRRRFLGPAELRERGADLDAGGRQLSGNSMTCPSGPRRGIEWDGEAGVTRSAALRPAIAVGSSARERSRRARTVAASPLQR
jgi:hypothetical protein